MRSSRLRALGVTLVLTCALAAISCTVFGAGVLTGEVQFARDVELPEGAVVIVTLSDTSLADAPAKELARDEIEGAGKLPVRFSLTYDADAIASGNEYSLSAQVRLGEELLYINDTVHAVLARGAPQNSDIRVVSTDPSDRCVEPLPGMIHSSTADQNLPPGAELRVRLMDVSDPDDKVVVAQAVRRGVDSFPIGFELPHDGVSINRHARYEFEAEIWVADELTFNIPRPEWRQIVLPHCPNADLMLVNDVFPIGAIQ